MSALLWNTFFIVIYAYLGIVAGFVLSKIAPEEIKPGRRYFNYAHFFLLLFLILFVYFFGLIDINIFSFALVFIGVIIGFFEANIFLFLGMGIVFFSNELAIVFATITFVYGMIVVSLKPDKKALFYNSLYYFTPVILFFIAVSFRAIAARYEMPLIFGVFLAYFYKLIFKKKSL